MAYTELVSSFATIVNRSTNQVTSPGQSSIPPTQSGTTSLKEQARFGRLDVILKALSDKGLKNQLTSSVLRGQLALRNNTKGCGTSGLAGAVRNRLIYFKPL